MKNLGDVLLTQGSIKEIVMGNTAIVRAIVETHTRVVTSYPGSPTPEIATAIKSIPEKDRPFYFEFSVNEKVATEVAFGAGLNGNLSCVFFKSVGLNVALDTFVQLGLMNITGGMVVVVGDDPGANSSQNEQDNRHIFRMARLTVFEPASPTEVYLYYKKAAKLARKEKTAVVLRLTTHVCHARESVSFGPFHPLPSPVDAGFDKANGPYIPITTLAIALKERSMGKLTRSEAFIQASDVNTVVPGTTSMKRGLITAGLPFLSLMDVLQEAKKKPDILKLGAIYPLDKDAVTMFIRDHDEILIIEELDPILETEIKAHAFTHGINVKIRGKEAESDLIGEYTPDKVMEILRRTWPDLFPAKSDDIPSETDIPARPAQMCPGCGHRSAFHAIRQALEGNEITVADIGCHTLGFLPPYNMGEVLMCMGASPGIASGLSLYNKNRPLVAFLGDSTLFHAGLPGIINTIFNNHNITLIIMENGTTAMTGHQDHAGREISIESMLKGLGIENIFRCDTYQQQKLTDYVKAAITIDGLSVVIATHPCMLKLTRAQRKKKGYVPQRVVVDDNACTRAHVCVEDFACPTFIRKKDQSIGINPDLCIGDGSCRPVCPERAIEIHRRNP